MVGSLQRYGRICGFVLVAGSVPAGAAASRLHAAPPPMRGMSSESVIYAFDRPGISNPTASLIVDSTGTLYGTAGQGGNGESPSGACYATGGCGGVFKLTPKGSGFTETTLYEFTGGADGAGPFAELYMDAKGILYGTTTYNGSANCQLGCGTVFELVPFGSNSYGEVTLYDFQGGTDGEHPVAGLVADASGNLYGVTQAGGDPNGDGLVFKLTRKSEKKYKESVLYRFHGCSNPSLSCDGSNPSASLYMDPSGRLFGTTIYGGQYQCPENNLCGTAFRLTPKRKHYKEDVIYNFQGGNDGANSQGSLIADASGNLYGTTVLGGGSTYPPCSFASTVRGCGVVFKLSPNGKGYKETLLHVFQGYSDGANPQAGLYSDSSGNLYGTTQLGGVLSGIGGCGTVFKLAPSGSSYTESILYDFKGCGYGGGDADAPRAGVIEFNNALYGTSFQGGGAGWGTVFRVSPP